MLLLNSDVISTFSAYSRQSFEGRLLEHLREFFPSWYANKDASTRHAFIHAAIDKASTYHIVRERDVAKFVDLMVALNPAFDVDPDMPWVQPLLVDMAQTAEHRLEAIYRTLLKQLGVKTILDGDR